MKRVYCSLIFLLAVLLSATQTKANDVIVKGTVKYSNGNPASNHLVTISIDTLSSNTICRQSHVRYTNPNGLYSDTLTCSSGIARVRVTTPNCDGSLLVKYETVPSTGILEMNFVICLPRPATCISNFNVNIDTTSLIVKFNSETSKGISNTDDIVKRRWRFGDGQVLEGNVINPAHTYAKKGAYQTCLTIVTAAGCEKTECKYVVFDTVSTNTVCRAEFNVTFTNSNRKVAKFNSTKAPVSMGDSIVRRTWRFGDGEMLEGNDAAPQHTYAQDSTYNVCLKIRTASGCEKEVCKLVEVKSSATTLHCSAKFTFNALAISSSVPANTFKFKSNTSEVPAGDSIRERIWKFGDGVTIANAIEPTHTYASPASYTACLIIRTKNGCSDTTCVTIQATAEPQPSCKAELAFSVAATRVKFNSSSSAADSIVARTWEFGDGTSLKGNIKDPTHEYRQPGDYNVCLTTETRSGCVSKVCKQVVTTQSVTQCISHFTFERIAPKKVRFNSNTTSVPAGDSIIERKWSFGDGTVLNGNVINPGKEYARRGIYTVCLKLKTAKGCENQYCIPVRLEDSAGPTSTTPLRIVSLYPTPVTVQMNAVVASLQNNVEVELSIHDIYGVKKWSMKKVLLKGENVNAVPTSSLLSGAYFFRVTSMYGVQSRQFYKL